MPLNIRQPEPYNYSADLCAGRMDLQADAHCLFGTLFPPELTLLDVGSGQGRIKDRVPYPTTTWDIDSRLGPAPAGCGWVDAAGPEAFPQGSFDLVTAFDVLEHVELDRAFLSSLSNCARRAVFVTTPNWFVTRCNEAKGGSTHHWREYTAGELLGLALTSSRKFPDLLLLAYYKDAAGGWWEFPRPGLPEPLRRRHGLLLCSTQDDHHRIRHAVLDAAQPNRTPG